MLIQFICFFFPALFSVFALEKIMRTNFTLKDYLFSYSLNTVLINVLTVFLVLCFTGSSRIAFVNEKGLSLYYTLAYFGLSIFITAVITFAESLYFSKLNVYVDEADKETEKTETEDNKE